MRSLPTLHTLGLLGVVVLLLVGTAGVVAQQQEIKVDGEPDLELYLPQDTVTPGEVNELSLQIVNKGELDSGQETNRQLVTTARNVIVDVNDDELPFTVTTGTTSVGSVTEDAPTEVPIEIEIPEAVEPGTYEVEIDMEYQYTSSVRESGTFADQNQGSRSITREITIEVDDGPRFRVENVSSDLRVGEEGEITGTLVNTGEEDATNVEVQFPDDSENIFPLETAVAVGNLPAGESTEFRIPIEVGSEAEDVPKRFDLPVSFRDENGIRTTDESPELLAAIASERDEFAVEAADSSIAAGETRTVEFTVTNNRNETLTAIEPKLFTDSPFSSDDDEAFIQSLEPGESETVRFELTAAGSATQKTHPVTIDFRYDDADGSSRITDSYRVAIDVTAAEDSGGLGPLGSIVVGLISVLALGGGYVWYRDQ